MAKAKKVLGCAAGIGVSLGVLLVVSVVAVLLMEEGVPEKLLVRFGALITIAGMAVGYRVSKAIGEPSEGDAASG